jgi:glutaredoxin
VFRDDGRSERALFVVDREGIVRYVDVHDIDEQPDNEEIFKVLRQLEPDAVVPARTETAGEVAVAEAQPTVARASERKPVVLYCRPGCIDCRLARRFLERNSVPYTEVNIRAVPEAEAQVRQWTGGPIVSPVFDIDGTIVIDFKRSELLRILELE